MTVPVHPISADQAKRACESCTHYKPLFAQATYKASSNCTYCGKSVSSFAFVDTLASVVAGRLQELRDTSTPAYPIYRRPRPVGEVIQKNLEAANADMVNDLIAAVAKIDVGVSLAPSEQHLWIFDREDHEAEDRAWEHFQTMLRSGSRFFNEKIRDFLDDLFAILEKLSAGGLLIEVKPQTVLESGRLLYRARRANNHEEFQPIAQDLARQLHAPPPNKTPANRMNVERSPAFYAALDHETAIAETRPSIGSRVVVGEFKTTRTLKAVNFGVLSRSGGAWFSIREADYRKRAVMRGLLRKLQERIARPIPMGAEY